VDGRDVAAGHAAILQSGQMGFGDRQIGLDAEQQRHIDVDPFADQRPDRRNAGQRARDLDHQIGPVHGPPQPPGFDQRAFGVMGQMRGDLEADEAVATAQPAPERMELVGGGLDVGHGQALVEVDHLAAGLRHERHQGLS
jgi:hypothetical protein